MKVLVINPIMYTAETKNIRRVASIKDTMISNSEMYIENCMKYRYKLSTKQRVEQFLEVKI